MAAPVDLVPAPGAPVTDAGPLSERARRRLGLSFWLPGTWLTLVVVGAITAPWLKHVPLIRLQSATKASPGKRVIAAMPSAKHWLGTDELGKDIFSRVVWGSRVALSVGVAAVLLAMVVGGVLGIVSGYLRGKVELVLNVLVGTLLAFPALVLVIAITAFRGRSLTVISFAIAIVAVPAFARVAYACTLAVAQREYVLAARSLGAKNLRIMVREVLPNVLLPLLAFALVVTAVAIVAEASLAFLGLSVSLGTPSWGSMIDAGRKLLIERGKWTISFFPALAMFLTVLSLNLLGEKVREFIDPRDAKL